MPITEIPLRLPGVVLASAMPFSSYDPSGELFEFFCDSNVSAVVVLCTVEEMLDVAGRDLRDLYRSVGMQVIYLPIADFSIPETEALKSAVQAAIVHVSAGGNLAVHCHGGVGRTGLFTACMAARVLNMDGEQAIEWVRKYLPNAVETEEQRKLVIDVERTGC